MRPQRIDITGQTDASGNASIPVKLPVTGEWFDLKFALGTTAPAEWAILVGGTPLTYGRGRRVTLGPELIQTGEVVTVSVTGGPASAQISGSANGRSGDPMAILAGFVPSPNTIALDTAAPHQALKPVTLTTSLATPSFTVASGALSGAKIFTVTPGTVAIRVMATANGLLFTYQLLVLGRQSNVQYFGDQGAPGAAVAVPSPTLPLTIPIEVDWDTQIEIHVENPTQNVNVFVSALDDVEAPGQAGAAQSVIIPIPAPWQVPAAVAEIMNSSIANGSAATLIAAAPAGLDTYLFWCTLLGNATSLFYTLKGHTSGTVIGVGLTGATTAGTGPQLVKDFHGAKMGDLTGVAGEAVDLFNNGGAPVNFFGTLDYRYA